MAILRWALHYARVNVATVLPHPLWWEQNVPYTTYPWTHSPGGSFSEQFYSLRRSPADLHGNETLGRRKIVLSLLCLVRSHRCFSKLRLLFCVTYICLVCTISYFKTITAYTSRMLCHSLLPLHCQLTVEVLQSHTMYNNRTSKLHIVHACIAHAVACLLHATRMSCAATPCSVQCHISKWNWTDYSQCCRRRTTSCPLAGGVALSSTPTSLSTLTSLHSGRYSVLKIIIIKVTINSVLGHNKYSWKNGYMSLGPG